MRKQASILAAVFLTACSAEMAFGADALNPENPLLSSLNRSAFYEEFVARALRQFDNFSRGSTTITRDDLELRDLRRQASERAAQISTILRFDLDGDLKVTKAEYDRVCSADSKPQKVVERVDAYSQRVVTRVDPGIQRTWDRYDVDKNGLIELMEIAAAVNTTPRNNYESKTFTALMATSLGKDGALTREEIKSLAERTFKAADKDRDGKLSDEEYAHVRAIRMAGQQDGAAPCRYC